MKEFGTIFLAFFFGLFSSVYKAFVAGFLWLWFVTPIFGIEVPSIWLLAGFATLIHLFTFTAPPMNTTNESDPLLILIYSVLVSCVVTTGAFFGGWLFHTFS